MTDLHGDGNGGYEQDHTDANRFQNRDTSVQQGHHDGDGYNDRNDHQYHGNLIQDTGEPSFDLMIVGHH